MAAAAQGEASELIPMYQFNLMGGQYLVSGSRTSLTGDAYGNVAPAIKYSDSWTLLPSYTINYQGTKPVDDPVPSGSLFQQRLDNRVSATGIYTDPTGEWRVKPNFNAMWELLKETRDETWSGGLFDYQKAGVGFEVEDMYKEPFSVRVGYDFYYIRFPHYNSLESQSGVDPLGNPLGRAEAGTNVLDTVNNQLSIVATRPFPYDNPKVALQASYTVDYQQFLNQPLVNSAGQYQSSDRQDVLQTLSLTGTLPRSLELFGDPYRLAHRFTIGGSFDGSNQNNYDASGAVPKYVPDFYSYTSVFVGPSWVLSWGPEKTPGWASFGLLYTRQHYLGRLTQDGSGLYGGDTQFQDRYLISLGYGYPIGEGLSLKAQAGFLWAKSNMHYQATYSYNYATANYLAGFSYDY